MKFAIQTVRTLRCCPIAVSCQYLLDCLALWLSHLKLQLLKTGFRTWFRFDLQMVLDSRHFKNAFCGSSANAWERWKKKGRVENQFLKQRHLLRKMHLTWKRKTKQNQIKKTIKSATGHRYKTMYNDHMVESAGRGQSRAWLQTAQRPINILHNIELYIYFSLSFSLIFAASEEATRVRPSGRSSRR